MASWSYSTGERGRNRVRTYEQARDGRLFLESREHGTRVVVALPTQDRETAKRKADELAARLAQPEAGSAARLTLRQLFDIYGQEQTPLKGAGKQGHDKRAARTILEILGPARLAHSLTHRDALRFLAERRRRGDTRCTEPKARAIGARTAAYDVRHLRCVLTWAVGAGWLERNPLDGFRIPGEQNPRRPVLTAAQYDALAGCAADVHPTFRLAVVLAHETGHRIGSIRRLRWADLDLEAEVVLWRAEFDKMRREHRTPLTGAAVDALKAARRAGAVISEWVIPSPADPGQPIAVDTLNYWWRRGEALAQLPHVRGRGWHSLRRLFATELKHVPIMDLCELGGWKSPQTVLTCYQQPDPVTMREALAQRGRLEAVN